LYELLGTCDHSNTAWVRVRLCELQKGCTRLATDKVYQLLAHGWWFSPGIPASSTTKTGRHDIAEILLKVALNTKNQINHILLSNRFTMSGDGYLRNNFNKCENKFAKLSILLLKG
jgi:hypothetical protein